MASSRQVHTKSLFIQTTYSTVVDYQTVDCFELFSLSAYIPINDPSSLNLLMSKSPPYSPILSSSLSICLPKSSDRDILSNLGPFSSLKNKKRKHQ